ncbi:SpoVR family protein [Ammoniphilus sp. 3BR4]|uniref:SpoVR family protein n=1 Tax=Ammoniphilus sp. 3BR4 TaxID=3158265 RepID=UPI0034671BBF
MTSEEKKQLERAIDEITEIAVGFGLDFYPMRYEICPADIIYTFGAYGMPTRFSHWSFGKSFHRMKLQYDLGLSKIYELVINSNPCYAFLLDGNSLIQNKLIVAHVLAHCDFFKNNIRFSNTNRDMVESMSASAERIRQYEILYGKQEVESFLDAILAIQEHIDPSLFSSKLRWSSNERKYSQEATRRSPKGQYDDLWGLDPEEQARRKALEESEVKPVKFPPEPEKDLLLFIEGYASHLQDWQRDILTIMRNEMLYFWPQLETKIMNEGWASYWHQRIIREMELTESETIEFAKLNAGVVQPSTTSINPYYLGLKMFEYIERKWDNPSAEDQLKYGREKGQGRKKIFEIRELDSDISFIRNYLTKELVEELDMYVFAKQGNDWTITDKTWETVRDQLVTSRVNGGFPYMTVENGDYLKNGELYIKHHFEGMELDIKYVEKTLPYVYKLWGKTVHLESTVEERQVLFSHDGKKTHRRFL